MIAGMAPWLDPRSYVFCTGGGAHLAALASFVEDEGLSQVLPLNLAHEAGGETSSPMARIVLKVYSSLEGSGLTAAVAGVLAEQAIPCNMIAAFHHDHVFVPRELAERAMAVLQDLQRRQARG